MTSDYLSTESSPSVSPETSNAVLRCVGVEKRYQQGPQKIQVLRGIELAVHAAEHVAIVGASGSGKSTLLNVLGGLDQPCEGEVHIHGKPFSRCSDNERGRIRNRQLGFVYQFHHLLPEFSAAENVAMPAMIGGQSRQKSLVQAKVLLEQVGLSHRVAHKPSELSGGERQRVAIARALMNRPACVLMDEPTGNLDTENALQIQALMQNLSREVSTSFIVVTHDRDLAATMDRTYCLEGGYLGLAAKSDQLDGGSID